MDIETIFMKYFSIEKKPIDIFELIRAAIRVDAFKYPSEFEKHKNKILKMITHPGKSNDDLVLSDEEEEDDDNSVGDEEEDDEEVFNVEQEESEKEKESAQSKNKITATTAIKRKESTSTESVTEMKKRSVKEQLDGDKEGIRQSHNTTAVNMGSMSLTKMNVAIKRVEVAPPCEKQLYSDCSPQLKKLVEEGEQATEEKQNYKRFKKMHESDWPVQNKKPDCDTEKKREEGAQRNPIRHRKNHIRVNIGSGRR
ncbi:hypothetical protein RND71_001325 [Anisodus tanguticus]|uniref:Uncharacterized protein n=1 Tax=Anisodus tanguticus TaxID=243964 RepID=A0AAE1VQT1_9SOLA|nr:hypothetical protein RND71_001325 [Anisodus tanguticus]